jgi:hypothetical protein
MQPGFGKGHEPWRNGFRGVMSILSSSRLRFEPMHGDTHSGRQQTLTAMGVTG